MTRHMVAEVVMRMASENPRWSYTRIRGALANLGHDVARNTVKRILQDHGIEPAPERSRRNALEEFLQAHWAGLAAADPLEVLTLAGLRPYFVLFVIGLRSRRVKIAGIHPQPCGDWMARTLGRNPWYIQAPQDVLGWEPMAARSRRLSPPVHPATDLLAPAAPPTEGLNDHQ